MKKIEIVAFINDVNELDITDVFAFINEAREKGVEVAYLNKTWTEKLEEFIDINDGIIIFYRGPHGTTPKKLVTALLRYLKD